MLFLLHGLLNKESATLRYTNSKDADHLRGLEFRDVRERSIVLTEY